MQGPSNESISTLLVRCAAVSTAAGEWSSLAERLTPRLRGAVVSTLTLCRVPRRADLIDELVQEIWCRLLVGDRRVLRRYRGNSEGEASAYLRRVASTIVLDRLRAERAAKRGAGRELELERSVRGGPRLADRRGCPERRLLARERIRDLAALCGELVGANRRVERLTIVRLAVIEGRSSQEIVSRVGPPWSVGRINSFLFRLRHRLAERGVRLPARARGSGA